MDFFGKLLKEADKALKSATSDENKEKAKNFLNQLGEALEDVAGEVKEKIGDFKIEKPEKKNEPAYKEEYYEEDPEDTRSAEEKILKVLAEEFPQFEVRKDVSPLTIGGTGRFMNYSIGVYDAQGPVLFMMLIGKTTCSHREYRWSKEEAEKAGIRMINFIEHAPNKEEYIKERLHKYLG